MGLGGEQSGPAEPGTGPDAPPGAVPVTPATTWGIRALPEAAAEPGYDDLLRQCVASARVIVAADAGYALVADEDGNLTVRGTAGISPAALLRSAPRSPPCRSWSKAGSPGCSRSRPCCPAGSATVTCSACSSSPTAWRPSWNAPGSRNSSRPAGPASRCSRRPANCCPARWTPTWSWPPPGRSWCPGWPSGARCSSPGRTGTCGSRRPGTLTTRPATPSPGCWSGAAPPCRGRARSPLAGPAIRGAGR